MPARKAHAPGTCPVHLPVRGTALPQSKVFGRIFILGYLHLLATMPTSAQVFYSVAGKFSIVGKMADIVVNISVYDICQTTFDEFLRHQLHLRNMVCCPGVDMCGQDVQLI